ncbi:MAG: hypothetical protein JXA53_08510, partial [Bacteroidales bacterium]|nr:hypothetical protein [Bacteroidales bacterium]
FATGFEPSTCMPFGITRDTIIISNPQDDVVYKWDFNSWVIDTTSLANSVIFYTNTNSQTITLTAINTCETKIFKYTISCCN